jgi:predicted AAA+ superfamily ATPase
MINNILVGRREEQKKLDMILKSGSSEFIAVYGRRRVGKTYLIKTFFQKQDVIFFHITGTRDASMAEQIADFTRILESTFYRNEFEIKNPPDWKKAFELLTKAIERESVNKKVVLFFDELPWLASKRSRFIQALDYYWNRFWQDNSNIKLIVCGSAASWMIENVIRNKGGLHNRLTGHIPLYPFDLHDTKEYLTIKMCQFNDAQMLDIFMILGGVPYYLNLLNKNLSVPQNIDQICFQKNGVLFDEFNRLYSSLFNHAESYEELIQIIASKRNGIERTEIAKQSKYSTDGGRLKERLDALEQSGFIISFIPYGHLKRRIFYRVVDEYSYFYLKWIAPSRTALRKLDQSTGYWMEKYQLPGWRSWSGYAFEAVCYKHIAQIRKALGISVSAHVGSWQYIPAKGSHEDGAQIDLLFDRDDGVISICEIKMTSQPYQMDKEEAALMIRKMKVFQKRTKTQKQIQWVLISNMSIKETMYSEELVSQRVTLDELMHV